MPDEPVRELAWAAALHEIGMSVSHHDHHRHSAYLVANVDAPGFSQSQQRRVAELVLGHRGDLRKLPNLKDETVAWQVLCLRVAALLAHARSDVPDGVAMLERSPHGALLSIDHEWAAGHPRTMYLLAEEQQVWARSGGLRLEWSAAGGRAASGVAADVTCEALAARDQPAPRGTCAKRSVCSVGMCTLSAHLSLFGLWTYTVRWDTTVSGLSVTLRTPPSR